MAQKTHKKGSLSNITMEQVNRVLDVGRLLLAVLTEEELAELPEICGEHKLALRVDGQ